MLYNIPMVIKGISYGVGEEKEKKRDKRQMLNVSPNVSLITSTLLRNVPFFKDD
jgi:hypothetical protein